MLSTEELKHHIYGQIQSKLGNVSCDSVFFAEGKNNSVEGTYIFAKNGQYHILFTEKGTIRSDIETSDEREVLWHAIAAFSFNIILDFATRHKETGKDFRRAYFAKEIEIFSLFGKEFAARKTAEIEEILRRNPYNDV